MSDSDDDLCVRHEEWEKGEALEDSDQDSRVITYYCRNCRYAEALILRRANCPVCETVFWRHNDAIYPECEDCRLFFKQHYGPDYQDATDEALCAQKRRRKT